MTVRQINLTDDELCERLFVEVGRSDPFMRPLIRNHVLSHREGDEESTNWIRAALGWDS